MRNRRGLSTVVGAVFFVIAATTVISYISYSMNTIDQFAESVIVKEAENINRGLEDITISKISIDGGEFNMTVVNTGSLPVHLTRLWITDEDSAIPDQKLDLDVRINPGNEAIKIGQGTGVSADSTISYTLKLVTERGNLATFQVSPDVSTSLSLLAPGGVDLDQNIRVTGYITNNSTKPNNIANLVPILKSNVTMTVIDGPNPPSIQTLPQGNTAVFTWTYQAPSNAQGVSFNLTYAGAPTPVPSIWSNTTVAKAGEAELAGTSEWSQSAKRVGILISGIPSPLTDSISTKGKFGIGVINPLNRDIQIYAVGFLSPSQSILAGLPTQDEPTSGWRLLSEEFQSLLTWEGGSNPLTVGPFDIAQFRVQSRATAFEGGEGILMIQALTSEGKYTVTHTVTVADDHPTMNVYYTTDPLAPTTNWGYMIEDLPSGRNDQIINATVENSSNNALTSEVMLIILVPKDFSDVKSYGSNTGWDPTIVITNPDGSKVINVNTTATTFPTNTALTYQFTFDNPTVTDTKLYVLQTTTVYPGWSSGSEIQLASALSEAALEVVP